MVHSGSLNAAALVSPTLHLTAEYCRVSADMNPLHSKPEIDNSDDDSLSPDGALPVSVICHGATAGQTLIVLYASFYPSTSAFCLIYVLCCGSTSAS